MTMLSQVEREFSQLQKKIHQDNRKLEALRMVIKEYATDDYPGSERLNMLAIECIRKANGQATFQRIAECMEDHQITIPRNRLSILLTKNPALEYDKIQKIWKIAPSLPDSNENLK